MSVQTDLSRKESQQSSIDLEKSTIRCSEQVNLPPTITEEEERNNAGLHEYLEAANLEVTPQMVS